MPLTADDIVMKFNYIKSLHPDDNLRPVHVRNVFTVRNFATLVAEIERLREETTWVRNKLGLELDASSDYVYGKMHVLSHQAHGYVNYIEAHKCNDKQGEISRLSKRLVELEHQLAAARAQEDPNGM